MHLRPYFRCTYSLGRMTILRYLSNTNLLIDPVVWEFRWILISLKTILSQSTPRDQGSCLTRPCHCLSRVEAWMSTETPLGKVLKGFYKPNRQCQSFMPKHYRGPRAPLKLMIGLWSRKTLPMGRSDYGVEWKRLDVRDELHNASSARSPTCRETMDALDSRVRRKDDWSAGARKSLWSESR
jgi:hypothetical protein